MKKSSKSVFCVIAYDIADTKRRNKVIKLIKPYGARINYSVYECMFTISQFENIKLQISELILNNEDNVVYYRVCLNCFSHIIYQPERKTTRKPIVTLD